MLSEKMNKALNKQINEEIFSSYLYYAMAAYFDSKGLSGFSNWMRVQTQEELSHAAKLNDYINERGGRVVLEAIAKPALEWDSPLAAFEAAYQHEQHISKCINDLVDIAIAERDHATNNFLQWFVKEQVEEEASADEIVQKLKLVGENKGGMFMVNRELAARVYTPPAADE